MIWVLNPVWEYFNCKSVIRDETECEVICVFVILIPCSWFCDTFTDDDDRDWCMCFCAFLLNLSRSHTHTHLKSFLPKLQKTINIQTEARLHYWNQPGSQSEAKVF